MSNLFDAIARSVGSDLPGPPAFAGASGESLGHPSKPVLQLNPFPITIDPNAYWGPRTDANPDGDFLSLFRFGQLVDPVPAFGRYYSQSGKSTEDLYGRILSGMSVKDGNPFLARLKADTQRKYENSVFANMGGIPGNWRAAYAVPDDWYDMSKMGRYRDLTLDLSVEGERDSPFTLIGNEKPMELRSGGGSGPYVSLDSTTTIHSVKLSYLLVEIRRPWLNPLLFDSDGWYLSGQPQGWCSSGRTDENTGVFPLLCTGMLLARDISVDADWSTTNQAFLESAEAAQIPVFLGPLPLSRTPDRSLQIIGWISSVVPFSPRASDLRSGSILLRNEGAFVCRFSVEWRQSGRPATEKSGSFPALAAKSIEVPPDASSVLVKVEVMTFPVPFETWKTVAVYTFDRPVTKCYRISGTTWGASLQEIPGTA